MIGGHAVITTIIIVEFPLTPKDESQRLKFDMIKFALDMP